MQGRRGGGEGRGKPPPLVLWLISDHSVLFNLLLHTEAVTWGLFCLCVKTCGF